MYSVQDTAEAVGFPIRKSTDQSLFAPPHGLSQRITSFIASQRQGIHQMPLSRLIVLIINAHPLMRCRPNSVIGFQQMAIATAPPILALPARRGRQVLAESTVRKTSCKICPSAVRSGPARFPRQGGTEFVQRGRTRQILYLLHDVIEPAHKGPDSHTAITGTFMGKLVL